MIIMSSYMQKKQTKHSISQWEKTAFFRTHYCPQCAASPVICFAVDNNISWYGKTLPTQKLMITGEQKWQFVV